MASFHSLHLPSLPMTLTLGNSRHSNERRGLWNSATRCNPYWLSSVAETIEKLFVRAEAAIAEARRLLEINQYWQERMQSDIDRMFLRADFQPQIRKLLYPQDIQENRPPHQVISSENDG